MVATEMSSSLSSVKQRLLSRWPKCAIYARYFKGLFRDEAELRLLPWLCDRSRASVDAGAHHGIYSLGTSLFSKRVIAVEPQAHVAHDLRKALPPGVSLIECALSAHPATGIIRIPVSDWDSIARLELDSDGSDEPQWRRQPVRLMRMDDVVAEPVGFIKIDVEGHELEVLEGSKNVILNNKPTLLIEIEERHRKGALGAVQSFLDVYGYQGYFAFRGEVRPINEFNLEFHQDLSLIRSGDRCNYSDYINNFIFIQKPSILPKIVPSPWRGLAASLQQMF